MSNNDKNKNDGAIIWLPPNSTCFGTRNSIAIGHDGGGDSTTTSTTSTTTGMVATFYCPSQEEKESYLLVLVHDGTNTFQGRIPPSQATKVTWENFVASNKDDNKTTCTNTTTSTPLNDRNKIEILSRLLLQNVDRIRISYHYYYKDINNEGIKLVIRQHMATTDMMRFLWSQVLEPVKNNLTFVNILGQFINQNNQDIVSLQKNKKELHDNLVHWKDTSQKLDRDWQEEKDHLLQRFLKLYQTAHSDLGQARLEISSWKRQLAEASQEAMAVLVESQTKKRPRPSSSSPSSFSYYANLPDDQDNEQFDTEMVEMLAAGKKTRLKKTGDGDGTKQKAKKSSSSLSNSVGAVRKNPMTGAQEVFDADAVLNDPSFFGISQKDMEEDYSATKKDSATKTSTNGKSNKKKDDTTKSTSSDKNEVMEDTLSDNKKDTSETKTATTSLPANDPMAFASALFAKKGNTKENSKKNSANDSSPPSEKRSKTDSTKMTTKDSSSDDIMAAASQLFGKKG